jgi:lipid-A-disaccharide synthase
VKRLFFVAGESSGDIHGSNLIRALRAARPGWSFEGLGGKLMAEAGMDLRHDLAGEAIMGFAEVLRHLAPLRRLFHDTVARLRDTRPDALILIDYPGFNLRLAAEAKKLGIPVVYYISPQVWAWKKRRIHTIARLVDLMLVIFPFEEDLYRRVGVPCAYVGHPLLDHIALYHASDSESREMVIGLLPGSREQELRRIAPVMFEVAAGIRERHPEARFIVPCVSEARAEQVRALAGGFPAELRVGGMYDVLSRARFCLVASGTATLETALFDVPMAILYKTSALTYWIARMVVDIKHIGIVNILAKRGVVPEFIQHGATRGTVLPAALDLIQDTPARRQMLDDLNAVREGLGGVGASARAAEKIIALVEKTAHE